MKKVLERLAWQQIMPPAFLLRSYLIKEAQI